MESRQNMTRSIKCQSLELGKGSFATVYLGVYQGQQVAVKKVPLSLVKENGDSVLVKLIHPNIVCLFHSESDKWFRYFALEFCQGTLKDFGEKKYQGCIPGEIDGLLQMAQGLCYIHNQNFIHKEIKPENVLISQLNSSILFKVSDFDLCSSMNKLCDNFGTLSFQAPEILVLVCTDFLETWGTRPGDVFSLGCVFYYFLTKGSHPFGNKKLFTINNILMDHQQLNDLGEQHFARSLIGNMIQSEPVDRPSIFNIVKQLKGIEKENGLQEPNGQQNITSVNLLEPQKNLHLIGIRHFFKYCYKEANSKSRVFWCSFHPWKPKLACALTRGSICIMSGSDSLISWDKKIVRVASPSGVNTLEWNFDGTKLACGLGNGKVAIWDEDGDSVVQNRIHKSQITVIKWKPNDSNLFVTGSVDKNAILWDQAANVISVFEFHAKSILDMTWMLCDKFATCSDDETIQICQMNQHQPLTVLRHTRPVSSVRWNKAEEILASSSLDGFVKIWPPVGDALFLRTNGKAIHCMDWFSRVKRNGKLISVIACGTQDAKVVVWNLKLPKLRPLLLEDHTSPVISVAFSPNGERLASVEAKGYLKIWATHQWKVIYECNSVNCSFSNCLAWDPTSRILVAASNAPEVTVVEIPSSEDRT